MRITLPALTLTLLALAPAGAFAQSPGTPQTSAPNPGDCAASVAEPATPPAPGQDGTAPGNAGTTGWTGGTGGSLIGTTPSGKTRDSVTWQPPTARGLDLKGAPEPVAKC